MTTPVDVREYLNTGRTYVNLDPTSHGYPGSVCLYVIADRAALYALCTGSTAVTHGHGHGG